MFKYLAKHSLHCSSFYLVKSICLCFLLLKCTRLRLNTKLTLRSVTEQLHADEVAYSSSLAVRAGIHSAMAVDRSSEVAVKTPRRVH